MEYGHGISAGLLICITPINEQFLCTEQFYVDSYFSVKISGSQWGKGMFENFTHFKEQRDV